MDCLCSSLAVRQVQFATVNVNVPPFELLDFGKPTSCQKKKAEGGHCISAVRLFAFRLSQYTPKPLQLRV